ncbi:MAG: septum formation inhibitor Maf [Acidobacteria bacterium]|nr:septum formation inhibitor Maf [Acidobacteriota bacterium]
MILASASLRRAELLESAGFTFDVVPAEVDETPHPGEVAAAYTLRVARDKAREVAARHSSPDVAVLGADTEVVADGRILGKPADWADASRMLRLLSGGVHDVVTAVVIVRRRSEAVEVVTTRVRFVPLSEVELTWYVATGEPMGKAGAYAIQGRGARFIDRIEGSWSNVVGLPVASVHRLLGEVE